MRGPAGLLQLGNTCYLASAVQVILAHRPLRVVLKTTSHMFDGNSIAHELSRVAERLWEFASPCVPRVLHARVAAASPNQELLAPGQHDTVVAAQTLLERVIGDLRRCASSLPSRMMTTTTHYRTCMGAGCTAAGVGLYNLAYPSVRLQVMG